MKRGLVVALALGFIVAMPLLQTADVVGAGGAFRLPIVFGSQAFAAEDVVLNDIAIATGPIEIRIPRITVTASTLTKAQLQALFQTPLGLATADTLARFDASAVVIPEIQIGVPASLPDSDRFPRAVYRDLRFRDVKSGKAARVSASGLSIDVPGPRPASLVLGAFAATDYDAVAGLRFLFASAAPGEQAKRIVGPASIESWHLRANGIDLLGGTIGLGEVAARPLKSPLVQQIAAFGAGGLIQSKDQLIKAAHFVQDLYASYSAGAVSFADISLHVPDPSFKGATLKSFTFGPLSNGRLGEIGIKGLDIDSKGPHILIGQAGIYGFDAMPFAAEIGAMPAEGYISLDTIDWRKAAPKLDAITLKDAALSVPVAGQPASTRLGDVELRFTDFINSVPTKIHLSVDHLTGDSAISALMLMGSDARFVQSLGYKSVDMSASADIGWNEAARTITLGDIKLNGVDMGAVTFKAVLANAARELFDGNIPQMQVTGVGLGLSEATLRVENATILARILDAAAREQARYGNKSVEQIRAGFGTDASNEIARALGSTDKAKSFAGVIGSFLASPTNLSVTVKAKSATGLSITDVFAGGRPNPPVTFDKLVVTATTGAAPPPVPPPLPAPQVEEKDYVKYFREKAQAGDADAMVALGSCLYGGNGTAKNEAEGLKWIRRGLLAGSDKAMWHLAHMHFYGIGVPVDKGEAGSWYKKSADIGDTQSMDALALMFDKGDGLDVSPDQAARWALTSVRHQPEHLDQTQLLYEHGTLFTLPTRAAVQRILTAAGIYKGPVNGVFDDSTIEAIKAYAIAK